jgi:hypothetical protein
MNCIYFIYVLITKDYDRHIGRDVLALGRVVHVEGLFLYK